MKWTFERYSSRLGASLLSVPISHHAATHGPPLVWWLLSSTWASTVCLPLLLLRPNNLLRFCLKLEPPRTGSIDPSRMPCSIIISILSCFVASAGMSRGPPMFGGKYVRTHLPLLSSRRAEMGRISVRKLAVMKWRKEENDWTGHTNDPPDKSHIPLSPAAVFQHIMRMDRLL